jgi:hypothetical protein
MNAAPERVSKNKSTTLHEVNKNWKQVPSRQSSDPKKLMKHVTASNSLLFATSNWHSVLDGLKQTDRSGNKSTKQWNKKHLT